MSTKIAEVADRILKELSAQDLEQQNQILETITKKITSTRDREAQALEHQAMLLRNSNNDLKNRLVYLNHK